MYSFTAVSDVKYCCPCYLGSTSVVILCHTSTRHAALNLKQNYCIEKYVDLLTFNSEFKLILNVLAAFNNSTFLIYLKSISFLIKNCCIKSFIYLFKVTHYTFLLFFKNLTKN